MKLIKRFKHRFYDPENALLEMIMAGILEFPKNVHVQDVFSKITLNTIIKYFYSLRKCVFVIDAHITWMFADFDDGWFAITRTHNCL